MMDRLKSVLAKYFGCPEGLRMSILELKKRYLSEPCLTGGVLFCYGSQTRSKK
jgi:hypothetical protein